jgi:hypothetical protein
VSSCELRSVALADRLGGSSFTGMNRRGRRTSREISPGEMREFYLTDMGSEDRSALQGLQAAGERGLFAFDHLCQQDIIESW